MTLQVLRRYFPVVLRVEHAWTAATFPRKVRGRNSVALRAHGDPLFATSRRRIWLVPTTVDLTASVGVVRATVSPALDARPEYHTCEVRKEKLAREI
jgi:hypothetical protein